MKNITIRTLERNLFKPHNGGDAEFTKRALLLAPESESNVTSIFSSLVLGARGEKLKGLLGQENVQAFGLFDLTPGSVPTTSKMHGIATVSTISNGQERIIHNLALGLGLDEYDFDFLRGIRLALPHRSRLVMPFDVPDATQGHILQGLGVTMSVSSASH
jgi:hypothetical protein